ncbi:MAG: DUF1971 domain-containing protein [Gammaproteobacteria bacterium]|nr:DUF1971 domain-containing protein [Gammaproteobacteria bacterium]
MEKLPDDVRLTRKTPEFDEITVPKGLLKAHQTKAGVLGKPANLAGCASRELRMGSSILMSGFD